ncbi:MAG: two-component sensor histidine kinase, partial [Rhizobiales bacterium]|nr:two-component sensor histidine kinase [Hyphomicrobiales bacterium]
MSGVIAAIRRTMLSCTSLVRDGMIGLAATTALAASPAQASDLGSALAIFADLDQRGIMAMLLSSSVACFSVLAAILLMRTRMRAATNERRLKTDLHALQAETDRYRALLFAEPQVLISWPAG